MCENKFTFKKPKKPNLVHLADRDENISTTEESELLPDEEDGDLIDAVEHFERQNQPDNESDIYFHKKFRFQTYNENKTEMPNFDIGWEWND